MPYHTKCNTHIIEELQYIHFATTNEDLKLIETFIYTFLKIVYFLYFVFYMFIFYFLTLQ